MCVQRSKVIGHADRRIQSYGSNPCLLTPRADLANRRRRKKKIKFEQISEVEASQTVKLCLSQVKSGYNCCKVKLHIRFKARKKDKHHNNINTKKCSKTENSAYGRESGNPQKLRRKNKVDDQKLEELAIK